MKEIKFDWVITLEENELSELLNILSDSIIDNTFGTAADKNKEKVEKIATMKSKIWEKLVLVRKDT